MYELNSPLIYIEFTAQSDPEEFFVQGKVRYQAISIELRMLIGTFDRSSKHFGQKL